MSLNNEERRAVVSLEYEKATKTFSNIPTLIAGEMWDFVANRLYYAAFHAVLALLINDEHKTSTHRGLGALFGLHYVKTGMFTAEEGRMFARLQGMRDEADYNCAYNASKEDIEPYVKQVEAFIKKIGTHLTVLN